MKVFMILTVLSFSLSSFAFETKDVECPAFAESNKRESKVVQEDAKKETVKESNVYQD